jgi:ketosteroid isomerase-like protein
MRYLLLFLFGLLYLLPLHAQQKNTESVAAAVELLRQAMISGNADSLAMLLSDELSYGHSNGFVEGKQSFVEKIASGKSDFVSIELTNQIIDISGKLAIVRHQLTATNNDGGIAGSAKLKVLLVYQLKKGRWLLFARQAVKFV